VRVHERKKQEAVLKDTRRQYFSIGRGSENQICYSIASGRVMEKCGSVEAGYLSCLEKLDIGSDKPVRVLKYTEAKSDFIRGITHKAMAIQKAQPETLAEDKLTELL